MNKSKAMQLIAKQDSSFNNRNTIFSNLVFNDQKWWLQPSNDKFDNDLNIVLNNSISSKLHLFHVPANSITQARTNFKQRNDAYRTNCSDIYIPESDSKFKELNGFDFKKYLIKTIGY